MLEEKIQENILLSPFTTLKIGGLARYFVDATDEETIYKTVKWAKKANLPLFVLGGGSNLVISDDGFPGLVLHINNLGIVSKIVENKIIVSVAAGEIWDNFVLQAVNNGWSGIECLSGIPGKVGATPIQNVGAYGQEVKDTIIKVKAYDRFTEKIVEFDALECEFSYRQSLFKTKAKNRYIVINVTYALTLKDESTIKYPELKKYLSEKFSLTPSLLQTREAVINIRCRKAMVVDENEPDSFSVGSFFVNPIIELEKLEVLKEKLRLKNIKETIPEFPAESGKVKLSAAWLIERVGFRKGYRKGNVAISSKHALALINSGDGTAREIGDLALEIQQKVVEDFDIWLEVEPVFV
ncbi:MAG: UDP-N-acetylmuramate dehydrogenase [Blastocatellia bacterium]|nr:UDP-N-acetylmuramate dehydrogenase [Blastocatellia bacterium]